MSSESENHKHLIEVGIEFIKKQIPVNFLPFLQADYSGFSRPLKEISHCIPDIYLWKDDLLIIGEAKTYDDFSRKHSLFQYDAYLDACKDFYGHAVLIIIVPWQIVNDAYNTFTLLKRNKNIANAKIFILNELGDEKQI